MQNKSYSKSVKILVAIGLLLCFVLVRFYEKVLFYDPFLVYFKGNFNQMPLPEFNTLKLILSLMFRYGLNMFISLALIYIIFEDKKMIQFSFFLYLIAFLILILFFFLILHIYGSENNFVLFYIRRFLIQPIFVLLFIPGFYFQKRQ
ncbi:MAG: exosortase F system-associated protein [Flavobacterium sp.]